MRIPFSAPTVSDSDATKLGLCGKWEKYTFDTAGGRIFKLLPYPNYVATDYADWSEVDSGGKVNLSAGEWTFDGDGTWSHNGIFKTSGLTLAEGFIEFQACSDGAAAGLVGFNIAGALSTGASPYIYFSTSSYVSWYTMGGGILIYLPTTNGVYYTHRFYFYKDELGNIKEWMMTIQGGTEYSVERVVCRGAKTTYTDFGATIYPMINRKDSNAGNLLRVKNFRACLGYSVDGPRLTYVADAGKLFAVSSAGTMVAGDLEDPEAAVTGAVVFTGGATGVLRSYNATTGKANIHSISGTPQTGTVTCTATGHTFTISDVGAQCYFDGFDLTRFKPVGSWVTTNAKFRLTVDAGAAGSYLTLAQLNAVGKIAQPYRVVLDVQANSDGATQQYVGEVNSPDATESIFTLPAAGDILTGVTINTVAGDTSNLTAGNAKFQSLEAGRNVKVSPLSAVPSPANGGPEEWTQLGDAMVGTGAGANPNAAFDVRLSSAVVAVGGTLTVTGGVTFDTTATGVTVTLRRYKKSDDTLVATVINTTADFVATVQKTLAAILGATVTVTPATAQEEYLILAVSGGTPTVTSETGQRYGYVVKPAFTVPGLAVVDDEDGSVTCTVTNNASQTSRLKYMHSSASAWTVHGTSITGNGTISDLTGLSKGAGAGYYKFQLVPYDSTTGLEGVASGVTVLHLEDSTATVQKSDFEDQFEDGLAEVLDAKGITATYSPYGGTPAEVTVAWEQREYISMENPETHVLVYRSSVWGVTASFASPDRRDTFTIDGVLYPVKDQPLKRAGRWTFELERTIRVAQAGGAIRKGG